MLTTLRTHQRRVTESRPTGRPPLCGAAAKPESPATSFQSTYDVLSEFSFLLQLLDTDQKGDEQKCHIK